MLPPRRHSTFGMLVLISLCPFIASQANAQEALREQLRGLAQKVGKFVTAKGHNDIVVGNYTFSGGNPVTSGPVITQMLIEEFAKLKPPITAGARAKYTLYGTFRGQIVDESKLTVVINSELKDSLGNLVDSSATVATEVKQTVPTELKQTVSTVADERTFVQLLQPPGTLPEGGSKKHRANAVISALDGVVGHQIEGTQIFADAISPYGIEILVGGIPVKPELRGKEVFVPLKRDDEYEIRLINRSGFMASNTINIDGLNSFTFSDLKNDKGEPQFNSFIVSPEDDVTIAGWFRDLKTVDAFRISEYAKSAAASLNQTQGIGTVQVIVAAAWPEGTAPPLELNEKSRRALPDGTARGRTKEQASKPVAVEVGEVRASICVRYSTGETPK